MDALHPDVLRLILLHATHVPCALETDSETLSTEDRYTVLAAVESSYITKTSLMLVSRGFRDLAERFLYEVIFLKKPDHADQLADLLAEARQGKPPRGHWCLRLELNLLDIDRTNFMMEAITMWRLLPPCTAVHTIILAVSSVEQLPFLYERFRYVAPVGLILALAHRGTSLRRIDIIGDIQVAVDHLDYILRSCPNLDSLSVPGARDDQRILEWANANVTAHHIASTTGYRLRYPLPNPLVPPGQPIGSETDAAQYISRTPGYSTVSWSPLEPTNHLMPEMIFEVPDRPGYAPHLRYSYVPPPRNDVWVRREHQDPTLLHVRFCQYINAQAVLHNPPPQVPPRKDYCIHPLHRLETSRFLHLLTHWSFPSLYTLALTKSEFSDGWSRAADCGLVQFGARVETLLVEGVPRKLHEWLQLLPNLRRFAFGGFTDDPPFIIPPLHEHLESITVLNPNPIFHLTLLDWVTLVRSKGLLPSLNQIRVPRYRLLNKSGLATLITRAEELQMRVVQESDPSPSPVPGSVTLNVHRKPEWVRFSACGLARAFLNMHFRRLHTLVRLHQYISPNVLIIGFQVSCIRSSLVLLRIRYDTLGFTTTTTLVGAEAAMAWIECNTAKYGPVSQ